VLASHHASVDQVASWLGTNRRALHRQLARDGETFSSMFEAGCIDMARRYIDDRGRPLGEVAHLLGFSEFSGFSRWFRAQFGYGPKSWRQAERNCARAHPSSVPLPHRAERHTVKLVLMASQFAMNW
jgi:AraC-like DNA-binding protein